MKVLKMQLRKSARTLALAVGVIALAAPVLTSCGFDYATDRVYTPASGVNDREASVDVLGAVIVSAQDDSGTFIASFANNDQDRPATVDSLSGAGDDSSLQVDEFDPIEIAPGQLVNLATDGGVPVHGSFSTGEFVTVSITFGNGESVEMDVPSVTDCGIWEGLDTSGESGAGDSTSTTPSESDQCGASGAPEQE